MSLRVKERIFWLALCICVFLHLDLWGWGWIEPMLFGWIPYHMWYHGLLTLLVAACMIWLAVWPEPLGTSPKAESHKENKKRSS
jgi:hypothetical protein